MTVRAPFTAATRSCARRGLIGAVAALLCTLARAADPAPDNPFVGTWVMDVPASHYASEEAPSRMVVYLESTMGAEHYRSTTEYHERSLTAEYTADYQGSLALVLGDSGMLSPVSLRRIDDNTMEATYRRAFAILATCRRVVSADRQIMTITTTSFRADGKPVVNVGVYRKVARSPSEGTPAAE